MAGSDFFSSFFLLQRVRCPFLAIGLTSAALVLPGCPNFGGGAFSPPDGDEETDVSGDLGTDDGAPEADVGPEAEVPPDMPADPAGEDPADGSVDDGGPADTASEDAAEEDSVTPPAEDCSNGEDDDHDGRIDCADEDCGTSSACSEICNPLGPVNCGDTVSGRNDGAGSTDRVYEGGCFDESDYSGPEVAYTFTLSGRRNVEVGLRDLSEDLDLFVLDNDTGACESDGCMAMSVNSGSSSELIEETLEAGTYYILINGWNDAVSDYTLRITCTDPEICDNGIDDDGDGFTDCDDFDCEGTVWCPVEAYCNNGVDDDGDTLTDCDDPDCEDASVCTERVCNDEVDNDGDTLTDCDDPDCADSSVCTP
jgi:hypothetical protein